VTREGLRKKMSAIDEKKDENVTEIPIDEKKDENVTEIPIDEKKDENLTEIPIDEKAEDLKDEKSVDEAAQAIFWETFLDKVVAGIMNSFGWANSNLVNQAMIVTVAFNISSSVGLLWAFFAIVFIITLLGGTWGLACCTKCANCLCPLAPDIVDSEADESRERSGTSVELGARMASSTGQTILITMFDILFIRTLPIVSAMAFNNAAQKSFELIARGHGNDENEKYRNFAMWCYAITMTIGVLQFLSCYSGCISDEEMDNAAEIDEDGNRRADTSDNMTKKYFFQLMGMVLQCSLALAYRLALSTIFKSLFGGDNGALIGVYWVYTALITAFTVIVLTSSDRYACCVPTRAGLPFQTNTRSRNLLTDTIGGAMKLNVAFAWLDSIFASLAPLAGTDKIMGTLITMLLAYAIFVVADYLIQKFLLSLVEKLNSGVFAAAGAVRRSVSNDNEKRAPEATEEETNNTSEYCGDLCTQSLLIISASLVVVSGNSVAPFVEAVVLNLQDVEKIEDLTNPTGLWIAVAISVVFCALVASWLGCCVAGAKAATAGVMKGTTAGMRKISGVSGSEKPEVELETKDNMGSEIPADLKE